MCIIGRQVDAAFAPPVPTTQGCKLVKGQTAAQIPFSFARFIPGDYVISQIRYDIYLEFVVDRRQPPYSPLTRMRVHHEVQRLPDEVSRISEK